MIETSNSHEMNVSFMDADEINGRVLQVISGEMTLSYSKFARLQSTSIGGLALGAKQSMIKLQHSEFFGCSTPSQGCSISFINNEND